MGRKSRGRATKSGNTTDKVDQRYSREISPSASTTGSAGDTVDFLQQQAWEARGRQEMSGPYSRSLIRGGSMENVIANFGAYSIEEGPEHHSSESTQWPASMYEAPLSSTGYMAQGDTTGFYSSGAGQGSEVLGASYAPSSSWGIGGPSSGGYGDASVTSSVGFAQQGDNTYTTGSYEGAQEIPRRREWSERSDAIENAFFERREYTPVKIITDEGIIIEGLKSLTWKELEGKVREANGNLPSFTRLSDMAAIREETIKDIGEARSFVQRRFGRRTGSRMTNKDAWEALMESRLRTRREYIPGSTTFETAPNPDYNCHSWTFANGRAGYICDEDVWAIIKGNGFQPILEKIGDQPPVRLSTEKYPDGKNPEPKLDIYLVTDKNNSIIHSGVFAGSKEFNHKSYLMGRSHAGGVQRHLMDLQPVNKEARAWTVYHTDRLGGRLVSPFF